MTEMSREANTEAEAPLNHQGGGRDGRGIDPISNIRYRESTYIYLHSNILTGQCLNISVPACYL